MSGLYQTDIEMSCEVYINLHEDFETYIKQIFRNWDFGSEKTGLGYSMNNLTIFGRDQDGDQDTIEAYDITFSPYYWGNSSLLNSVPQRFLSRLDSGTRNDSRVGEKLIVWNFTYNLILMLQNDLLYMFENQFKEATESESEEQNNDISELLGYILDNQTDEGWRHAYNVIKLSLADTNKGYYQTLLDLSKEWSQKGEEYLEQATNALIEEYITSLNCYNLMNCMKEGIGWNIKFEGGSPFGLEIDSEPLDLDLPDLWNLENTQLA